MVPNDVVLRARNCLAEFGFESTPDEIRNNSHAMEALELWLQPKHQEYLRDVSLALNELVESGDISNMEEFHEALERFLGDELTPKEVAAWVSLIEIFQGGFA